MADGETLRQVMGRDPQAGNAPRLATGAPPAAARLVTATEPSPAPIFGRRPARQGLTVTIGSAGHSYQVSPVLWIGGTALAATIAFVGIASAVYVAFHDRVLEYAVSQPIRMEQAYEDRIAALRSEIDRINSRQLIDQDAFEAKIDHLLAQQGELRQQQARVTGLLAKARDQKLDLGPDSSFLDLSTRGRPQPGTPATSSFTSASPGTTPAPPADPRPIEPTPLRSSWLQKVLPSIAGPDRLGARSPQRRIAEVETDLGRMQAAQAQSLASVAGLAETNSRTIERVVGRLGLKMADATPLPAIPKARPGLDDRTDTLRKSEDEDGSDAVGGPLEPIVSSATLLQRAEAAVDRLQRLRKSAGFVPLGVPINGPVEVTSPFGERPDPFLGVMAMHSGLDLRAHYGEPVEATAAGIVIKAERDGSYGNLVEIDHGNGLQTRYGHLSSFAVNAGQKVREGDVIGYVGSTGRSTGAHLHYETRVGGVAVNPQSYLAAGNQLRSLLN